VPARPYGKCRFSDGKAFGIGEGEVKSGAREKLSMILLHPNTILNLDISIGSAAFGEILMLTWGGGGYFRA
jgi:hypothetical protein